MTPHERRARTRAALNLARPHGARGWLPLALAALSAGKAIYGAINANQQKQRNKGYIDDAYRSAMRRQQVKEGDVRQATNEGLAARGLLTPGATRIGAAMGIDEAGQAAQRGELTPSADLGSRVQNETNREFALDRYDLSKARERAQNENKADAINAQIGSIMNGIGGIAQAKALSDYGAGVDASTQIANGGGGSVDDAMDAIRNQAIPGVQTTPSRIGAAMGADDPSMFWGGVHPLDFGRSTGTINGSGLNNSDFHL